ncbi:MAG: phosphate acyltransferase, partial [Vulcanimicrobiaceae bacterium]
MEFIRSAADRLRVLRPRLRVLFWEGDDPRVRDAVEHLIEIVAPVVVSTMPLAELPRGVEAIEMAEGAVSPCAFAAQLLHERRVDAAVGGAIASSAEFFRAGLKIVGLRNGCRTISTAGIVQPRRELPANRPMIFADVGTVPEPSSEQLADIAESTSRTWQSLFEEEPI